MTDRAQLHLRDLLLEMEATPTRERVVESVPSLVEVRFAAEEALLSESTKTRHLESIRLHVLERNNGTLPGLAGLLHRPRRQLLWPMAATVAVAVLIVLLLLNLPGGRGRGFESHGPGQPRSSPRQPAPEHKINPQQDDRVSERHQPKPGPREKTNLKPKPNRRNEPQRVAQRFEVGEFASVMGEPKVTTIGARKSRNAVPKMPVTTAMRIETGDADKAEIRFADGSTIALGFNTTVTVPAVQVGQGVHPVTASEVSVTAGSIEAHVAHSKTRGLFAVRTPVATAEVLGTEFSLALKHLPVKKGKTKLSAVLQVHEGRVAFYNELGRVVAGATMQSTATEDSAPTEPKRLPTLKVYSKVYWNEGGRVTLAEATRRLEGRDAETRYVYPLSSAGLEAEDLPSGEVRTVEVSPGLPAEKAGVRLGDLIIAMNGTPVRSAESLRITFSRRAGQRVKLTISRKGEASVVALTTVQGHPLEARLPRGLAERLFSATWPAIAGDSDKSLRLLSALAREVKSAAVYNNLGVVCETRDQLGPAIRNYQTAVRLDPNNPRFRCNLSFALGRIGNFERSAEEARKAVESDPMFRMGTLRLSRALCLLDRPNEALEVLEGARFAVDRFPEYWEEKAYVLHLCNRLNEAEAMYRKAIALGPRYVYGYCDFGSLLEDAGRVQEAESMFRKAIAVDPKYAFPYSNLAILLKARGDFQEAEAMVRRAIALEPRSPSEFNLLGLILRDRGRYREAEAKLRKAIALDPNDVTSYSNLGSLLQKLGRAQEGEAMYRHAIAIAPEDPIAYYNFGNLLKSAGRFREAEALYRKRIDLYPTDELAYVGLGDLLTKNGRKEAAEAMYRKAIDLDSRCGAAYSGLGGLFAHTERRAEAEAMYRKAIEFDPSSADAQGNLGVLLMDAGRYVEAEPFVHKSIALDPLDATMHANLGNLLSHTGRNEQAEVEYRESIKLDPKYAVAYYNFGSFLAQAGRSVEAEAMLRKAIEFDPKNAWAFTNLGTVLSGTPRVVEAEAMYSKAIELDPKFMLAYYGLGNLLVKTAHLEQAEAMYRKVVELNPNYAAAYSRLGLLFVNTGRVPEGVSMFRKVVELDPTSASAHQNLGMALVETGHYPEAEVMFRKAIELDPKRVLAYVNLGDLLARVARLKEAEAMLRKAIELDPNFEGSYEVLGGVLKDSGRFKEAEDLFRKAIALDPRLGTSIRSLAQILEQSGRLEEAETEYRNWVKADPKGPNALNALAWFLADHNLKLDDALEFGKRCVAAAPNNPNGIDTLGWVYYKRKEYEKAEEAFTRALALYKPAPAVADCWVHLGLAFEGLAQREKAIEAYRQALKLEPQHKDAHEALKRIGG